MVSKEGNDNPDDNLDNDANTDADDDTDDAEAEREWGLWQKAEQEKIKKGKEQVLEFIKGWAEAGVYKSEVEEKFFGQYNYLEIEYYLDRLEDEWKIVQKTDTSNPSFKKYFLPTTEDIAELKVKEEKHRERMNKAREKKDNERALRLVNEIAELLDFIKVSGEQGVIKREIWRDHFKDLNSTNFFFLFTMLEREKKIECKKTDGVWKYFSL